MKKRLLTLGAVAMYLSFNAQDAVTYIGNNAKLYVSGGALVYSGGKWKVDSEMASSVENRGNIVIKDNYVKGNNTRGEDGKEFVNIYRGKNDYGQVKILEQNGTASARMTLEKPAASSNYFGASYAIGIPFIDDVKYIMHSFGKQESDFRGDCNINEDCAQRYFMTLTKWNNNKLHHDAVYKDLYFQNGHYYNLNLRGKDMQDVMTSGGGIIPYKGKPSGSEYIQDANGIIEGLTEKVFSDLGYNDWKKKRNPYQEAYETYLGYANTTSKVYNKNVYRFANPYTSNLDLSVFEGDNAWLKIKNNGGNRNIKEAYDAQLIKKFSIRKRAEDYDVDWGKIVGGVNATAKYHIVEFDGNNWVGSPEALLIRPMETFNLHFPVLNVKNLGTRILNIEVKFNDNHKTFAHTPSATTTGANLNSGATVLSTMSVDSDKNEVLSASESNNNFSQLELFLVKDNAIQASPAYIVGSNYYKESGSTSLNTNDIYVYGVKDNEVSYDSKKEINEFNSLTYIAKPLGVGFNNLKLGETYELRFNLYEESIFNKVKNLNEGAFFLKDNYLNKVVKVDATTTYSFEANENVNERFAFYWKDVPASTNIVGVVDTPTEISHKTIVYKDSDVNKVRFEGDKESAKVEVYDASGRLVLSKEKLSVDTDYTLNLGTKGMYVIKVIYKNNETRILKLINN